MHYNGYTDIQAAQLQELLQQHAMTIVDMRDEHSYNAGHISGAIQASETNMRALTRKTNRDLPLLIYCYHGNSSRDLASFFVALGFSQIYHLEGGWAAWHTFNESSHSVQLQLANWLSSRGFEPANPNSRTENGMTALMTAIVENEESFVAELLDNNVDVNHVNDDENNALWFACFTENLSIIDKLIGSGIDIDHQNVNGATALIYAASAGKQTVVEKLIDAGADTGKVTLDGFSALDCAATYPILKRLKSITQAA